MRMEHCLFGMVWQQQSPVVLLAYILPAWQCSEKQIQFSFAMYHFLMSKRVACNPMTYVCNTLAACHAYLGLLAFMIYRHPL